MPTSSRSQALFARARSVLAGGGSRHTIYFPPHPVYAVSGKGCRVTDADGVERLDLVCNYTSLIHGHGHPAVVDAAHRQLDRLTAVGLPTEAEIELAELLAERLPSLQQLRFTNSGTEAVMMALKAARAFTGRPKIAKIEGAYHGTYDFAEVSMVSAPAEWGERSAPASTASAAGTPMAVLDNVVALPMNDVEAAQCLIGEHGRDLAAILIDPMPSRLGFIQARGDYLRALQSLAHAAGALLVLDEVYSFRLGYSGTQGRLGIAPDLTCLGKIIGGGFPVGAFGGRADVMAVFDVVGGPAKVPHGGTFNANPVTMAAGRAAMELMTKDAFARLNALGDRLRSGLRALPGASRSFQVMGEGSLTAVLLQPGEPRDHRDHWQNRNADAQAALFRALLDDGLYITPGGNITLSTAMTEADVDLVVERLSAVLPE